MPVRVSAIHATLIRIEARPSLGKDQVVVSLPGEESPGEDRQISFGVYADVGAPRTVRVGDPVHPLTEDDS